MVGVLAGALMLAGGLAQADVFNMPSGQTSMAFVTVGNPGNASDTRGARYGAVPYAYQMGKYDVTLGQYCQFLNAVATTSDPYGLYNSYMATGMPTVAITQSGTAGNHSYSVTGSYSQAANCPVFDVTWGDAARFCNWLQNNQPTGTEGPGTTETGAYTLNGATTDAALMAITRNAGATYFIPTEDEWYKAACYNPSNASYWFFPTQSNAIPSNVRSATGTNNANIRDDHSGYSDPTNFLTPVGAFAGSPGPYGTYDMGGDASQWTETAYGNDSRFTTGASWRQDWARFACNNTMNPDYPSDDDGSGDGGAGTTGFRVAASAVPEPASITLVVGGGLCLLAYAWRKRARTA
jgi:formylglycine-generating enzyme required for sulfatase activity